ncbi:hypothetical protein [Sphingomonas sp. Leaf4]|uniref:hypothetical protein n=1 Tax=Sphingomonas sp. Leaf4 TaxID=2876553 RepID=UPI001E4B08DA|nr:hypothetical protein [Sphingomonas sp. Leaf4]
MRGRVTIGLAAMLAGCGGAPVPAPEPTASVVMSVATPTPVPVPTATSAIPDAVTATTNEPFYSAAIDGDAIRLSGVDLPERRLGIVARDAVPDGRRWRAEGVTVTVIDQACADDMSGEPRPFRSVLTVGGRTARGCAFPTPRAQATIPAAFLGRWDRDAAACAAPATSIEGVTISPRELRFHESLGDVTAVTPVAGGVSIAVAYSGEGERWTTRQTLRVAGDVLTIAGEGAPIRRVRCPR